jgi:streptogramin lyase
MARRVVVVALLAVAIVAAPAGASDLRARVAPAPATLTTQVWSPSITLTRGGKPATARLVLSIRKAGERRSFRPTATRRGVYRARVRFPSEGRWTWSVTAGREILARGSTTVTLRVGFDLPYDLAVEPDGTVLFLDRGRVLALDPGSGRVRIHRRTSSSELVAMERVADGTLFVTDFPRDQILRIDSDGRERVVARVPAPADLVVDDQGMTAWVASIADAVGVVRVDLASGRVEPFSRAVNPHGIDRQQSGDFVVQDGRGVSRIDARTGALTRIADVEAIKLVALADGSVLGVEGDPGGGRVVRIAPNGSVTTLAGTGSLAPHRDGDALEAGILPSGVQLAADGALLIAQVQPVPAIRRVDLATGRITTLALGRQ